MNRIDTVLSEIENKKYDAALAPLYGNSEMELSLARGRYLHVAKAFGEIFPEAVEISFFSAPGRTEVGGNHTDHNHGCVLAAAVNLDIVAVASKSENTLIRFQSEGFPMDEVDISNLSIQENEKESSAALIRGVCYRMKELGYQIGGFDAYSASQVLKGSGLSSSAAFEVMVVTILNHLYNDGAIDGVTMAQIAQYAENVYFGKPSGLMDQTASAVGGFVAIDFHDPKHPVLEKVDLDLTSKGYALCIVDTGGSHFDLTSDYAAVPVEMKSVAKLLGHDVLRDCGFDTFMSRLPELREKVGDRAVLRAFHFFRENERAVLEKEALKADDFDAFKQLVLDSGFSSYQYLQNVFSVSNVSEQGVSLALAVSESVLKGKGAWRVHGGGFAGTIQAFVPFESLEEYKNTIEGVFGKNHCYVLSIRPAGGIQVI